MLHFLHEGNTADFGDLSAAKRGAAGLSNNTRSIFGGGRDPSVTNVIDYVTTNSLGNAADFGDLTAAASTTNGSFFQ